MGYPLGDGTAAGARSWGIANRGRQSLEVVRAGTARPQLHGDAREALRPVVAASDQVDINM